jgi:hypothetical protein
MDRSIDSIEGRGSSSILLSSSGARARGQSAPRRSSGAPARSSGEDLEWRGDSSVSSSSGAVSGSLRSWGASRRNRARVGPSGTLGSRVVVVIVNANSGHLLRRALAALQEQSRRPDKLIAFALKRRLRVALRAKVDAVRGLPAILRDRRTVQRTRVASAGELLAAMARGQDVLPVLTRRSRELAVASPREAAERPPSKPA